MQIDVAAATDPPFTLAAWVTTDNITQETCILSLADKDVNNRFCFIMVEGDTGGDPITLRIEAAEGVNSIRTTSGVTLGKWHHACGVVDSVNDRRVYIDGGSKTTVAGLARTPAGFDRTSVGQLGDSTPGSRFSGRIFLPAVWRAALTDFEIRQLAQGVLPWFIRPQSIVACWDANGRNIVNNRLALTAFNTPAWAGGYPDIRNIQMQPHGFVSAVAAVPILTPYAGYAVPVGS
jgi:hypothetical protein